MRASLVRGHGWDKIAMGADPMYRAFIPDPTLFDPTLKLVWTHDQTGKICSYIVTVRTFGSGSRHGATRHDPSGGNQILYSSWWRKFCFDLRSSAAASSSRQCCCVKGLEREGGRREREREREFEEVPILSYNMATSGLASAASSFVLASSLPTATTNTPSRVSFVTFSRPSRKLVVRAEEAAAPPPAPPAEAGVKEAAKPPPPPPIGPKRGAKVWMDIYMYRLITFRYSKHMQETY
ncbi:hypothetical protein B296_00006009 [Ensete ventricosum]|uniref:Uncharacterized protein n=1 Tax=Ensete ventricosum TaxID=4639 RepID=A0A427AWH8_ENSVE|nr:hypothetical protein B296_00006009 [Ensete ventricosum]